MKLRKKVEVFEKLLFSNKYKVKGLFSCYDCDTVKEMIEHTLLYLNDLYVKISFPGGKVKAILEWWDPDACEGGRITIEE